MFGIPAPFVLVLWLHRVGDIANTYIRDDTDTNTNACTKSYIRMHLWLTPKKQ
jgi:hypothetical protein